jgi:acyl-CoA reductase-like NAD-dependent aldehyde dehydrogenase
VLKPAETTSLTVLELMREIAAILPPGVVNIVTGYGAALGKSLVGHPDVRKVAFTGSTATGRKILQYASKNIIPQTLELGGKSANIVCADADLDAAAAGAALSTVFNKGEVCLAGSRLFVQRSVKDAFMEKFVAAIEAVQVGDPLHVATHLGAMSSKAQFDKVLSYIDVAREEGATIVTGGTAATGGALDKGYFIRPTILDDVTNSMRVAREEIFGPVTSVITWDTEEEVIAQANDSIYGLAGGLWTKDLSRTLRMTRALETGVVWVNTYYKLPMGMGVGGYKQSGFGREMSLHALEHYTQIKSVWVDLNQS